MKYWFCFIFTLLFACSVTAVNKKFTLVIDPGHGGKDHGAIGGFSKEKDLTLKFGLAFGRMVERNCPDVRVIYTRKTDVFIPLARRAEIANKYKSDLFISVHINALASGKRVSGVQTFTLGQGQRTGNRGIMENLEVAKRENNVILLEDNYQQTYQGYDPNSPESNIMFEFIQDKNMQQSVELAKLMQRHICAATGLADMGAHQNNLAVLRLSSMPGCLLELGFISTPQDEAYMNSPAAEDQYARGIFNAFVQYKDNYFKGLVVPYKTAPSVSPIIPEIVPEKYQQQATNHSQDNKMNAVAQIPTPDQSTTNTSSINNSKADNNQVAEVQSPNTTTSIAQPNTTTDNSPVFKIQILSVSRQLKANDSKLKGLKDCAYYLENGIYKYTYGASTNYNEIRKLRQQITNSFPDAFIIAFKNDQKIDVREGIREFLQNKKK